MPESPYIDSIMYGQTLAQDSVIRPAENHWHLVLVKTQGQVRSIIVEESCGSRPNPAITFSS